jgi:hypothetical protein
VTEPGHDAPHRVVVRHPLSLQIIGTLGMGFLSFGLWWAVVEAVLRQDWRYAWRDSGLGTTGMVVGWVIAGVLLTATTYGVGFLLRFRQVFSARGVGVRRVLMTRWIEVADMTTLSLVTARIRPGSPRVRQGRLVVQATTGRALLDPTMTDAGAALAVVASWVAARPDLGQDDGVRSLVAATHS